MCIISLNIHSHYNPNNPDNPRLAEANDQLMGSKPKPIEEKYQRKFAGFEFNVTKNVLQRDTIDYGTTFEIEEEDDQKSTADIAVGSEKRSAGSESKRSENNTENSETTGKSDTNESNSSTMNISNNPNNPHEEKDNKDCANCPGPCGGSQPSMHETVQVGSSSNTDISQSHTNNSKTSLIPHPHLLPDPALHTNTLNTQQDDRETKENQEHYLNISNNPSNPVDVDNETTGINQIVPTGPSDHLPNQNLNLNQTQAQRLPELPATSAEADHPNNPTQNSNNPTNIPGLIM